MNADFGHPNADASANLGKPVCMGSGLAALLRPGMTGMESIYRLKP